MSLDPIKMLIVDDSRIFRAVLEKGLTAEPDFCITGSVMNGRKAIEQINRKRPDVVSLDVEMPEMNGLETLQEIQRINRADQSARPIGVIMLSSLTHKGAETTIEALEQGAFDFISKPMDSDIALNVDSLTRQLVAKSRLFVSKTRNGKKATQVKASTLFPSAAKRPGRQTKKVQAIMIGVSTGGPNALQEMLPQLCEATELPICIVQHMPPTFTLSLAKSLDTKCAHTVVEAETGMIIQGQHIYIAPGGKHLLLKKINGQVQVVINEQPAENGCRPSVDVLFRSAVPAFDGRLLAIVLTGMGNDGAKSLTALKRDGAHVIAQDEASSIVWGMPGSAVQSGNVDRVLPLSDIPAGVAEFLQSPGRS